MVYSDIKFAVVSIYSMNKCLKIFRLLLAEWVNVNHQNVFLKFVLCSRIYRLEALPDNLFFTWVVNKIFVDISRRQILRLRNSWSCLIKLSRRLTLEWLNKIHSICIMARRSFHHLNFLCLFSFLFVGITWAWGWKTTSPWLENQFKLRN